MSAFVVDTTCMDRVVRGFDLLSGRPDLRSDLFRTHTGRELFNLNIEAVRQRYGSADDMLEDGWQVDNYQYSEPPPVPDCPPEVDSLKAMHCLIYQCSEGNVPEQPLYRTLVETSQMLEQRVLDQRKVEDVHDLPEYQRAEW